MKFLIVLAAALLAAASARAFVQQSGKVTQGHIAIFQYQNVISDGGISSAALSQYATQNGNNVFTGTNSHSGAETFTGPVSLFGGTNLSQSIAVTGSLLPSTTGVYGVQTITGSGRGPIYENYLQGNDTATVAAGNTAFWADIYHFGGASLTGNRIEKYLGCAQTSTTGNTGAGFAYSCISSQITAEANDNGTGTTSSTARGIFQDVNLIASTQSGATDLYEINPGEVDTNVVSGSSVYKKVGWAITQLGTDAVQGSGIDAGLLVANQTGAVGWNYGIQFGSPDGNSNGPVVSAGTLIGCAVNCGTALIGIDLSQFTLTTAFKSNGFSVNGSGGITATNVLNGSMGSYQLANVNAAATVPDILPIHSDANAGICADAAGDVSICADNSGTPVEVARFTGAQTLLNGQIVAAGGTIVLNQSSNNNTGLNTGTSTGVITLGNSGNTGKLVLADLGSDSGHTTSTVCASTSGLIAYSGSGANGVCGGTSSRSVKTEIFPIRADMSKLDSLPILQWHYSRNSGLDPKPLHYGPMAEDVDKTIHDIAIRDKTGKPVSYDWPSLLFAMQKRDNERFAEQKREIVTLEKRVALLERGK